jgi:hypothetical protein
MRFASTQILKTAAHCNRLVEPASRELAVFNTEFYRFPQLAAVLARNAPLKNALEMPQQILAPGTVRSNSRMLPMQANAYFHHGNCKCNTVFNVLLAKRLAMQDHLIVCTHKIIAGCRNHLISGKAYSVFYTGGPLRAIQEYSKGIVLTHCLAKGY